jgi:hypothetical protein
MQVVGVGEKTYILLSGLEVTTSIGLSENVELLPADTSHLDLTTALSTCTCADDIAVVAAFIPRITAQLKISASKPQELAILAWNSSWDALLLSAIFHTEVGFNLQSDTEGSLISENSRLRATNYHMHGLSQSTPYKLTIDDTEWINKNFHNARTLLKDDKFQTAAHCLASYRWHTMPRIKMAVLWAGIEGLFGANSEIRFRISLYIARFLHPTDANARKTVFEAVKKLYNSRSAAVHGAKIKNNLEQEVKDSAELLKKLIRQSIINRGIPNEDDLIP